MNSINNGGVERLREAVLGNIEDASNLEVNIGLLTNVYERGFSEVENKNFFEKDFMKKHEEMLKSCVSLVKNVFKIADKYAIYLDRPNDKFCCFMIGIAKAYI